MSLRTELQNILADILPVSPQDAVKGTELIQLIRLRLENDCSDATLRYNFSMMSADPASPIAKVEQGQGYYRRARPGEQSRQRHLASVAPSLLDERMTPTEGHVDLTLTRWQSYRALACRFLSDGNVARIYQFRANPDEDQARTSLWVYPDLVLADCTLAQGRDELKWNARQVQALSELGLPQFRLRAITFRVDLDYQNCRESFFQALSAGSWTHLPALHIASPIEDAGLAAELRRLGHQHGVEIVSYGLSGAMLDHLPNPETIWTLSEREFEAACSEVRSQVISAGATKSTLSADALAELAKYSPEVPDILDWVSRLQK